MRPLIDAAATRAASFDPAVSAEKNFGNPATTGVVHKLFRSVEAASHPWKLNRMKEQAPIGRGLTRAWSVLEAYAQNPSYRQSLHTQGHGFTPRRGRCETIERACGDYRAMVAAAHPLGSLSDWNQWWRSTNKESPDRRIA